MENEALDCKELYRKLGLEALMAGEGPTTFYGTLGTGKTFHPGDPRDEAALKAHISKFKICGEIGENPDTVNFRNFMKEIEERINADSEIIERSKECNIEFAECLRNFLTDPKNCICIGAMVAGLQIGCKRYSYIKHLNFNGKEYEAEIDELERRFRLMEV